MIVKWRGVRFDDIVEGPLGWFTQICETCHRKYSFPGEYVALNQAQGICGIEGCECDANHYLDFPDDEVTLARSDKDALPSNLTKY